MIMARIDDVVDESSESSLIQIDREYDSNAISSSTYSADDTSDESDMASIYGYDNENNKA